MERKRPWTARGRALKRGLWIDLRNGHPVATGRLHFTAAANRMTLKEVGDIEKALALINHDVANLDFVCHGL